MKQTIAAYRQDEEGSWVAVLTCGHSRHVRHEPPLSNRAWTQTAEGREAMLGTPFDCPECEPPPVNASAAVVWPRERAGYRDRMDTSTFDDVNAAIDDAYTYVVTTSAALDAQQLSQPTPCDGWTVRDLLGHLSTNTDQIVRILHGDKPDWGAPAASDPVPALAHAADASRKARHHDGAKDAEIMPGVTALDMNLIEVVGHAWDLGRSQGTDPTLAAATVETALGSYTRLPLDKMRGTSFGAPIEAGPQASALDRLVGLLGRSPEGKVAAKSRPKT